MAAIDDAPPWARTALELADDHPGREDDEVGISTITYDPSITYRRLKGEDVPDREDDGSMAKGTYLHWMLYHEAPNRETKVRVQVEGTDRYFAGHFDAFEDGTLRDLKTSDLFDLSDARWEGIDMQVDLYCYCVEHGEAWDPDAEEWVPAKEYLDTDGVEEWVIDFWGARGLKWRYRERSGDELVESMEATYAWACEQVKAMLADTWEPPTTEQAESLEKPQAPDDLQEAIIEAGHAKELADAAEEEYDEARAEIYEAQKSIGESVVAGGYMAVFNSPSTTMQLNTSRAEAIIQEIGGELADYQVETRFAAITDEEQLAMVLEELGLEEIEGVEIRTRHELDEDALRERLAELDPPEGSDAENALEACLEEKQTRKGYTYVKPTTDGEA